MNWREFIAEMTGNLAWPLVVGIVVSILILTQRKPIADLIGRIYEGQLPGGTKFKATKAEQTRAALEQVAAVDPVPDAKAIEQGSPDVPPEVAAKVDGLLAEERRDRQRQVTEVAKLAALWGQYMSDYMPNKRPGVYWEPKLDWHPDGSVAITYGQRGGYDVDDPQQQPEVRLSERITSKGERA
jgi:hypothetical protein